MSTFLDIPFTVWAAVCLTVALIYYFIWPKPKQNSMARPRWAHLLLRYGHSVVWVLLAGVFALWPTGANGIGQVLGLMALFLYAVFMVTIVVFGRKRKM